MLLASYLNYHNVWGYHEWRYHNRNVPFNRHENRHNVHGIPGFHGHFEDDDDNGDDFDEPFQFQPQHAWPEPHHINVEPRQQDRPVLQPRVVPARAARATPRIRESPEAFAQRRQVLKTFQCPFEVEENVCHKAQTNCLFGHNTLHQQNLKDIPSYLCTYSLLNICTSETPNDCINGLHVENIADLLDLKAFERRNRYLIRRYFGKDADRQCYICQENVVSKALSRKRRFAILERCAHVFCADCLKRWADENLTGFMRPGQVQCPVCRIVSDRFIIRRRFTDNVQQKRKLFQTRPQRVY